MPRTGLPVAFAVILAFPLLATGQVSDRIRIAGKEFPLLANPLEDYYTSEREKERPYFPSPGTSNWRGYVATWEIRDRRLNMVGISAMRLVRPPTPEEIEQEYNKRKGMPGWTPYDPKKQYSLIRLVLQGEKNRWAPYELKDLFPTQILDGRVFASWYSGELRVPEGKLLQYVHMGYGSVYERERFIQVKAGVVVSERVVDNRGKKLPDDIELMGQELEKMNQGAQEKPNSPLNQKILSDPQKAP
jgi:hypothetical protein